jgi:GNAT superfamily N-acetyltransferase
MSSASPLCLLGLRPEAAQSVLGVSLPPMTDVVVRRATPDDADLVGRMLFDFNTEFESPTPAAGELADRFRLLLARDDVLVLLAERPDPTGFALLTLRPTPYYDGPLVQLEELYVVPDLRDQGIGSALLTRAVGLAIEAGAGEMHINVDEIDTDTRRFYERHGFVNIEPGTDYRMLCYLREL